ncbi:MAG: hypothetical protein ACYDB2_04900 [Acidimicrobiales bacterium]
MVIGEVAAYLALLIAFSGMIGMGVLRARNARDRGRLDEARGRFVFISSVAAGAVVIFIGALAKSRAVGDIGLTVWIGGAAVGLTMTMRRRNPK